MSRIHREAAGYNERPIDPGNPTSGIYTRTGALAIAGVYTAATGEGTVADILERLEKTADIVLTRFDQAAPCNAPTRAIMQLHFAVGSSDGATAHDPVYGVRAGTIGGKPCVLVEKLWDRDVVLDSAAGTVGGGASGGGKENGGQFPEQSSTLTTTGVMEAHTAGAVAPTAWADGRTSGVSLADIGPYIALMRTPWVESGVPGVSAVVQRWR